MGAARGSDDEAGRPTLELSRGEDRDLLQHLLVGVEVQCPMPSVPRLEPFEAEEAGVIGGHCAEQADTAGMVGDASSVLDRRAPSTATPIMAWLMKTHMERCSIPPSMGWSTRYVVLRSFLIVIADKVWLFYLDHFFGAASPSRGSQSLSHRLVLCARPHDQDRRQATARPWLRWPESSLSRPCARLVQRASPALTWR